MLTDTFYFYFMEKYNHARVYTLYKMTTINEATGAITKIAVDEVI